MTRVFISYKREEQALAESVREWLAANGYTPWMDIYDIPAGAESWADAIEHGLQNCDVVLGLMSELSTASTNVKNEWDYTIVYGKKYATRLVLVKLDACTVPLNYIRYNYIDWRKPNAFDLLRRALDHPTPDPADAASATEQAYLEWLYNSLNRTLAAKIIFSDPTNPDPIRLYSDRTRGAVDALFEKTTEINPIFDAFGLDDLHSPTLAAEYADFAKAIEDFEGRLLLLGEPGAGKSISLLHQAREAVVRRVVDKSAPLPIFGIIAFWNAYDHPSWLPWLEEATLHKLPDVVGWLASGDLIIFADGLDELGSTKPIDPRQPDGATFDPRQRFMEQLPPNNRVLVACRVKDYGAIGPKIKLRGAVTLRALSFDQIAAFLSKMPPLLDAIQRDSRLREIVETPLLLSLFAAGYRDSDEADLRELADLAGSPGDLRDKIFERYVHDRYKHEALKYRLRGETVPYSLTEVYDRLGYVAVMNAAGGWRVEDNVLNDDYHGALDAAFAAFALQLDLVRPLADKDGLGFVHLRLRDYLAFAWGLLPPTHSRLTTEPNTDSRLIILRMLERVPDERAIPEVLNALKSHDRWVRRGAARVLGQIGNVSVVEPLISALEDSDKGVQRSAALALGQLKDAAAIPALTSVLNDTDEGVRSAATIALGQLPSEMVIPALQAILKTYSTQALPPALTVLGQLNWQPTTPEDYMMYYIMRQDWEALAGLGAVTLPTLLDLLSHGETHIRRGVAWVLGQVGNPSVVEPLIRALGDSDNRVQHTAVLALGQLGDEAAIPALINALNNNKKTVRSAATVALGQLPPEMVIPALYAVLETHNTKARSHALTVLEQFGWQPTTPEDTIEYHILRQDWETLADLGEAALPTLLDLLNHGEIHIRRGVSKVLGRLGEAVPLAVLVDKLTDTDHEVRLTIARLLEQREWEPPTTEAHIRYMIAARGWGVLPRFGTAALPLLLGMLKDPDVKVKSGIIKVLGELGDPSAIPHLLGALQDTSAKVRRAILEALSYFSAELPTEPLVKALTDKDTQVRLQAAQLLHERGWQPPTLNDQLPFYRALQDWGAIADLSHSSEIGEIAMMTLVDALNDGSGVMPIYIAHALQKLDRAIVMPVLLDTLGRLNNNQRRTLAYVLAELGSTTAVQALIDLLSSQDSALQRDAVIALGKAGDRAAVPALLEMLHHPHKRVRARVVDALSQLGDPVVIPNLIQALYDTAAGVRARAAAALGSFEAREALPHLDFASSDLDPGVRKEVELAIAQIGKRPRVTHSMPTTEDREIGDYPAAIQPQADLQRPPSIPDLLDALKDADSWVRNGAARALGSIGDTQAIPALIIALRDTDSGVRYSAAQALKLIDPAAATPALIEVFKEQDWRIRRDAAKTLAQLGSQALPTLLEALQHRNSRVRGNVAEVLGQIGDSQAVPALVAALQDKGKNGDGGRVYESAAQALEAIGTPEALEALHQWEQAHLGQPRRRPL